MKINRKMSQKKINKNITRELWGQMKIIWLTQMHKIWKEIIEEDIKIRRLNIQMRMREIRHRIKVWGQSQVRWANEL